jgi:putative chitinase
VIDANVLRIVMPLASAHADTFVQPFNDAMDIYEINTPLRIAMFLAQTAEESGELRYMREFASGEAYEGRKDLGNVHAGDGVKYKGRGLIEITGYDNYQRCSLAVYGDERLLDTPDILEQPSDACMSAGWFWSVNSLNDIADTGDVKAATRKINGGYNGLAEREAYYKRAVDALGGLS